MAKSLKTFRFEVLKGAIAIFKKKIKLIDTLDANIFRPFVKYKNIGFVIVSEQTKRIIQLRRTIQILIMNPDSVCQGKHAYLKINTP